MRLSIPRSLRSAAAVVLAGLSLGLAGCETANLPFGVGGAKTASAPAPAAPPPVQPAPQQPVAQQTLPPLVPPGQPAPVKAALLLPLTGPSAQVGQAMLNAAQMAVFEVAGPEFTLLPMDTRGSPEGAAAAAQTALGQGVNIILGPLFSADVKAASAVAGPAGVPVVAFTTDRTAAGNGTYIIGFLPQPQVLRVVEHARAQGLTRFAALAPNSDYGRLMIEGLTAAAAGTGAQLVQAEFYDPAAGNQAEVIQRLARSAGGAQGFQALLFADQDANRFRQTAALLPSLGIDPAQVKLLGTLLWDDARPQAEPSLLGGWFAAPTPTEWQAFEQRYQRAFGQRPPRIVSHAYDATALAAVLGRGRNFAQPALLNPSGFAGLDGLFRLRPDGLAERGLAVMEVAPEGPKVISPAPSSFGGAS